MSEEKKPNKIRALLEGWRKLQPLIAIKNFLVAIGLWPSVVTFVVALPTFIWQVMISGFGPLAIVMFLAAIALTLFIAELVENRLSKNPLKQEVGELKRSFVQFKRDVMGVDELPDFESDSVALEKLRDWIERTQFVSDTVHRANMNFAPLKITIQQKEHPDTSLYTDNLERIKNEARALKEALEQTFGFSDASYQELINDIRGAQKIEITQKKYERESRWFPSFAIYKELMERVATQNRLDSLLYFRRVEASTTIEDILNKPA